MAAMDNYIGMLPFSEPCKKKLHYLVQLIIDNIADVSMIVLFGSYARYEQKPTSDLDILVLTHKEVVRSLRGELCSKFDELGSDLVFYTDESFGNSDCLFARQVKKDGVLLWKN